MIRTAAQACIPYASPSAWFRGLWKNCIHTGSGSVITALGTNGAESLAPDTLAGIGLDGRQIISVFAVSTAVAAFRYVHETTKPGTTPIPFAPREKLNRPTTPPIP